MAELSVKLGPLTLKNPVMAASGTFGYGMEYREYCPPEKLGAVVVKGVSSFPWDGNPPPRAVEVSGGMLNAIGLQNPGVDKFLHNDEYLPALRRTGAVVIVNIWGKSIDDYRDVASKLAAEADGISALEINISCPNIKEGGIAFGTDLKLAAKVVSEVRKATKLPLITKLSPNVSKIADFAKAVIDSGSDIVSLINTIPGMAIDIKTRKPMIANITGGFSGPALKPLALRMVYEVANAVNAPIIGMGGISSADDAVEFMLAGADAVAVGTAIFADPTAPLRIIDGINRYLDDNKIGKASELVGKIELS
jgi:dihydroorotate dehydrogenase (NAD+) catalytic subunit